MSLTSSRTVESLKKLLQVAKTDVDLVREDLAELREARAAATTALGELDAAVRAEERHATADPAAFAAYVDGVRDRRLNLAATLRSLGAAEEEARLRMQAATVEMKKFERLLETTTAAELKFASRREQARADDLAAARAAAK